MQVTQLKEKIQEVFSDGYYAVALYACVRDDDQVVLRKINTSDALEMRIRRLLASEIQRLYLSDEVELEPMENMADNTRVLYEVGQSDTFHPFAFLNQAKTAPLYSPSDHSDLLGFAIVTERNDARLWFYQQTYAIAQVQRDRSVYAVLNGKVFTLLEKETLKIEERIDIAVIGDSLITSRIDVLQRQFGFSDYIRREAGKTLDTIRDVGLLKDTDKLDALLGKEALTFAKKLMKIRNSPVLCMEREELAGKLKMHPRYRNSFQFSEDDHVILRSQKDAKEFLKMLNDDFVRSDLSGREYDSPSKQLLAPLN